MTTISARDVWSAHAAQWRLIGPPLRPVPQDVQTMEEYVTRWSGARGADHPPRALLLGVTPEITAMRWPAGTRVFGADRSLGMIGSVWNRSAPCAAGVVAALWQRLPFAGSCFDLVLGDGSFTLMGLPQGYRDLARVLRGALRPGGRLIVRFYIRPDRPEPPERVFADLAAGRIGSFHAFKWRLVMSHYDPQERCARVARAWEAWRREGIRAADLSARFGWPPEVIATIDAYRDAPARYTFPTLGELRAALAQCFVEEDCRRPGYELGDRCPIMLLAPAG